MAEAKPPSTKDLFLLIAGLQVLKTRNDADSGEDYYLNEVNLTEERTLRDIDWNPFWLGSPQKAWDSVRYRDWLIATLAENIAGNKQEFTAISESLVVSLDVLSKEFKRSMPGITEALKQVLVTKAGNERSFFSA